MAKSLRIVIDHISGSRGGQRQELAVADRVSFGRHPGNDVTFDTHRDLDASSRHAELRRTEKRFQLVDIGSSNGTFVDGVRTRECEIPVGVATQIEFGAGGPRVRLCIGDEEQLRDLPGIDRGGESGVRQRRARWLLWLLLVVGLGAVTVAWWWR